MATPDTSCDFATSAEVIRHAVMMDMRFALSLRNVGDALHERGIDVSHGTVRFGWSRLGVLSAAEIRRRRRRCAKNGPRRQTETGSISSDRPATNLPQVSAFKRSLRPLFESVEKCH